MLAKHRRVIADFLYIVLLSATSILYHPALRDGRILFQSLPVCYEPFRLSSNVNLLF